MMVERQMSPNNLPRYATKKNLRKINCCEVLQFFAKQCAGEQNTCELSPLKESIVFHYVSTHCGLYMISRVFDAGCTPKKLSSGVESFSYLF